jgi:CheY-like chemotaxis protein
MSLTWVVTRMSRVLLFAVAASVAITSLVNQKLAILFLQRLGYRADVAANGVEAVAAVTNAPHDVILMDVQLPEMDGLEATRRIRGDIPADRQPRIVAMTANAMADDRRKCLAAGMDDYLAKPIRLEEVAAALAACEPPLNGPKADGFTLIPASDGTTVLDGIVVDQAALHGVLRKLADLGLPLISVMPTAPDGLPHT